MSFSADFTQGGAFDMKDFVTALEFLTRIRLSHRTEWQDKDFGHCLLYFPIVALFIGVFLSCINYFLLTLSTPIFLRSVLLIMAELFFIGSLMYDGYMDTCDGIFSARNREKMLEIMKDSRIGANAALGIVILLLFKFALYVSIDGNNLTVLFVPAFIVTRSMIVFFIMTYPYARQSGIGKMFKNYSKNWYVVFAIIFSSLVCIFLGELYCVLGVITFLIVNFFGIFLKFQLGGLTGDTYGFLTEIGFIVYLLSFVYLKELL